MTEEIIEIPKPVGPDEPGFARYLYERRLATNFPRATWQQTPESREKYKPGQKNAKGKAICGSICASLKDEPCQTSPMNNGRCMKHGGKAPRGAAHSGFGHGKKVASTARAKYLPARMITNYHEALNDEELLSMRSNLALLEARIADLLKRVDTGESGALWMKLLSLRKEAVELQVSGLHSEASSKIQEMFRVIGKGAGDVIAWNELNDAMERQRKLSDSEQKRLVAMQQMITMEQALTLVTALTVALRKIVEKEEDAGHLDSTISGRIIREVGTAFAGLLNSPGK